MVTYGLVPIERIVLMGTAFFIENGLNAFMALLTLAGLYQGRQMLKNSQNNKPRDDDDE